MRCLVIGASGQVGGHLLARCRTHGDDCLGTAFRHPRPGLAVLDLRDGAAVTALIDDFGPEVVYVPAALTHVDYGETHRDECHAVNVAGVGQVARALRRQGGRLVFFSTDHVFDDAAVAHPEDAPTRPRSAYAQGKAAAEELVRALLPGRHLILRTSWVFGPEEQGKNFVYRAARTLGRREVLIVPEDQSGQPTYAPDLAEAAVNLVRRGQGGTLHAVGPEALTRLAFARLIAEVFALDAGLVQGVPTAQLNQVAPRPLNVRLARTRLQAALGSDPIRHPRAALLDCRDRIREFLSPV